MFDLYIRYGLPTYFEVSYQLHIKYNNILVPPLVPVNCPQACGKNRPTRGARILYTIQDGLYHHLA